MAKKSEKLDYDESIYRRPLPLRIFGGFCKWFFGILGTLILMGVLTASIVACYGAVYIKDVVLPQSQVDMKSVTLGQDSVIYYTDPNTGEEQVLETLYSGEKQIWTDLKDIPENMINAAIAIEDKKFYEHGGVYWRRTFGAALGLLTGSDSYGGSTITQQLIKNMTENDEVTVKRKVMEIFQALEFENNHSKSEIMEAYLNIIYLGQNCNGVGAAAKAYFGKDVSELDLAECACIIGITNNPSKYDPLRTSIMKVKDENGNEVELTHKEANKQRQEVILYQMLDQGMITQEEYEQAVAEELQFVDKNAQSDDEDQESHVYSWFTDAVIDEVRADLMEEGYSKKAANLLIYSGGITIHTTLNPEIQAQVDAIYEDPSNFDYSSEKGQNLMSAITIVDNETGAVVALAGNVGEKTQSLGFNCATMAKRQPGSSFKPLAVYAPALESGKLLPSSAVDDCPLYYDEETGKAWPTNSYKYYNGLMSATDAVRRSSNAGAVQVLKEVGIQTSYDFLTQKFQISTLVESRETSSGTIQTDMDYGPLALGGLTDGVTTYEMAAAYSAFARNGEYVEPYLYTSVEASDGTVLLENTGEGEQIMKASTAYYMTEMLKTVMQEGGTGTSASFSGMSLAGKTGTTTNNYDRWFCGYSPYYTAAVWSGYDSPEQITTTKNPSALAWKMVMSSIHESLPDKGFNVPGETVTVTYCAASGKLMTSACKADPRGGQVKTGTFLVGDEPTTSCDVHTMVDVDLTSPIEEAPGLYKLASSVCKETTSIAVLNIDRDLTGFGLIAYPRDYYYTLPWLTAQGYSTNVGEEEEEEEEETESPEPTESPTESPSPSPGESESPGISEQPSQSPPAVPDPNPNPSPSPEPQPPSDDPEAPGNGGIG